MKKFLIFMLVLGLASNAWATGVMLIGPGTGPGSAGDPLEVGEPGRIYLGVDMTGLEQLAVTINSTGSGVSITGGILASEAEEYGVEATYYSAIPMTITDGGWQSGLSFNTAITGGIKAEIGLGHFGSTIYGATTVPVKTLDLLNGPLPDLTAINTPIAYLDVVGTGLGSVILSMVDGSRFGDHTKDGDGNITGGFGNPITIYGIPEPMTICLLGLGGLLLRRRR